uniref:EGF-like domain-containing protein n=1 Tax=Panagrolaimus sp. JU765 TaxID=591449 RepID=A0AC34R8W4_9BILA
MSSILHLKTSQQKLENEINVLSVNCGIAIQGKYCECDATSCPKDKDGRLCSGRGACDCGKCHCEEGFEGDDCGCESDETSYGYTGSFCSVSQASNSKDGQTLNEKDFNENEVEQENDGEVLPDSNAKDEAVEGNEKSEQNNQSSDSFKMQHLLTALVGLLIVKLGLILA